MKQIQQRILCVFIAGFAATAASAVSATGNRPATASIHDAQSQTALRAMSRSSTWGHPDEYGEFTGMQRYAAGDFKGAMKYFLIGARYADKLSQLSIGLMYLNGQGVHADPVTAFAWIAIAAERKYPQFLATRDAVWAQLDTSQRERAKVLVEKLYAEYGDATAKPRMAKVLRRNRTQLTGSMLGFGSESVASLTPGQFNETGPMPACGADTIGGAAMVGCGNIYAAWRWDPKQYFAARDSAWTGHVNVGAMQSVDPSQVPAKQPDKQKEIQ